MVLKAALKSARERDQASRPVRISGTVLSEVKPSIVDISTCNQKEKVARKPWKVAVEGDMIRLESLAWRANA